MTARDAILGAIRAASVPAAPAADIPTSPMSALDRDALRAEFVRVLAEVGGRGVVRAGGEPFDAFLTALLGDTASKAVVVPGRFAVAENGAVYVDAADLGARNSIVLAEHLVVLVPGDALVATMHEAVRRMPADSACGWFLSGPSKTADIEQSLVFGAQGSRTHHVVFES